MSRDNTYFNSYDERELSLHGFEAGGNKTKEMNQSSVNFIALFFFVLCP